MLIILKQNNLGYRTKRSSSLLTAGHFLFFLLVSATDVPTTALFCYVFFLFCSLRQNYHLISMAKPILARRLDFASFSWITPAIIG